MVQLGGQAQDSGRRGLARRLFERLKRGQTLGTGGQQCIQLSRQLWRQPIHDTLEDMLPGLLSLPGNQPAQGAIRGKEDIVLLQKRLGPHQQRPCLLQPAGFLEEKGFQHSDFGFTEAAPLQVLTDFLLVVDDGPSLLGVDLDGGRRNVDLNTDVGQDLIH